MIASDGLLGEGWCLLSLHSVSLEEGASASLHPVCLAVCKEAANLKLKKNNNLTYMDVIFQH